MGNAEKNVDVGKRKHISQMNNNEQALLWRRLNHVQEHEWKLTEHTLSRLKEKGIRATRNDIVSTIYNARIIEYRIVHNERYDSIDERVILRANAVVNGSYNLNAVYSLTNQRIITVWLNHVDDLHRTLDMKIYSAEMKVKGA